MRILSISYDLKAPHRNYESLHDAIKNISGKWAKVTESYWLVKTRLSAAYVRDNLKLKLDSNDVLFVAEVDDWAAYNLSREVVEWLKSPVKI